MSAGGPNEESTSTERSALEPDRADAGQNVEFVGQPDETGRTEYVVGFLLDQRNFDVALIRKNRPEWQAGRLNGIGGHVEPGERPYDAMCREFVEETGVTIRGWKPFVVMDFPGARITFFRLRLPLAVFRDLRSTTDEVVGIYPVHMVLGDFWPIIPNLSWLLPLATYTADEYKPIHVEARMAEAVEPLIKPAQRPHVVCPHDPPCRRLDSGWPACGAPRSTPGQDEGATRG